MATNRRLSLLLLILVSVFAIQQVNAWRERRSDDRRSARERSHIIEVAQHGVRTQSESARSGILWIGELHDDPEQPTDDVGSPDRVGPPTVRSIAGRIDLEKESLSAIFELHECDPGSPLCSTGGVITVFSGDQRVCVISVGILQPSEDGVPHSDYQVTWETREDGLALTDSERRQMLRSLARHNEVTDRVSFRRLLREAYGDDSQNVSPAASSESISKQIVSAVLMAIVRSRGSETLRP